MAVPCLLSNHWLRMQIMRKLRRLPWSETEPYLIRCLLSASVGRYSLAPALSSLTAGLSRYHPSLRIGVVDSLLEEVSTFNFPVMLILPPAAISMFIKRLY